MEGRVIEYSRPGGGLDYHNSPLIGEIPTSDYSYYRSIDQLRTINEREVLQTLSTSTPLHNVVATTIVPSITSATTDLRAIEFNHKSYMSSATERVNSINGVIETVGLHENPSNKHNNLMDDRANNNVHHFNNSNTTILKTKGYRKNRKNNRIASVNNSYNHAHTNDTSSLHQQQQQNNYHHSQHQQGQNFQQLHQSTTNNTNSNGSNSNNHSPHSNNVVALDEQHHRDDIGLVAGQTKETKVGRWSPYIHEIFFSIQKKIYKMRKVFNYRPLQLLK